MGHDKLIGIGAVNAANGYDPASLAYLLWRWLDKR
jgi:hypothetical protein